MQPKKEQVLPKKESKEEDIRRGKERMDAEGPSPQSQPIQAQAQKGKVPKSTATKTKKR